MNKAIELLEKIKDSTREGTDNRCGKVPSEKCIICLANKALAELQKQPEPSELSRKIREIVKFLDGEVSKRAIKEQSLDDMPFEERGKLANTIADLCALSIEAAGKLDRLQARIKELKEKQEP